MRPLYVAAFLLFLVPVNNLFSQCKADSVITYRIVNGINHVASIEYYVFDEKDSLVKTTLVEMQAGKAQPICEVAYRYFKSGAGPCIEAESRTWNPDRGVYKATSKHTTVYSKKGLVISDKYDRVGNAVVAESELNYTYNKSGQLQKKELRYWNEGAGKWVNESMITFTYLNGLQTESFSYVWDSTQQKWANDWRTVFSYDSLNELSETVSYQFKNAAWVPDSRTVYGKEPDKPVKWNIVQEWNGTKENWTNKYYYIFQQDEKGFTQKEIHLDWAGKEWQINMTFQYVYNDAGLLVQILNSSNQVMMDRFCRN
ncbi:MAG: DUF3836 domain-containing protein [Bacteroidetes bacterium]|nr:DUF3836 domain-containing protein [Bacteroidota bacterium]